MLDLFIYLRSGGGSGSSGSCSRTRVVASELDVLSLGLTRLLSSTLHLSHGFILEVNRGARDQGLLASLLHGSLHDRALLFSGNGGSLNGGIVVDGLTRKEIAN
jgi:hypothetical protein